MSLTYPPSSYEGIPRQRSILAQELVGLGHEVDVITIGQHSTLRMEQGVRVHEHAILPNGYFFESEELNTLLSSSQSLYEGFLQASCSEAFDIIDIPLWSAQGIVPLLREQATVIWLQTTTAQLLNFHHQTRNKTHQLIIALEQICLDRAAGILSDSQCAIQALSPDYRIPSSAILGLASLGLPDRVYPFVKRRDRDRIEALVVGRLERRKGSDILLFDILPRLLRRYPMLHVRFIGRDNSQHDGWYKQYRQSYMESFRQKHSRLIDQVHFEGYVSEAALEQAYAQADMMLVPSLYESFGLIYLEAMRAKLPIVSFKSGSATEIFPGGSRDGALIVSLDDTDGFTQAVEQLIQNPQQRETIGQAGYERFQAHYTARHMAQATLEHYRAVIDSQRTSKPKARVVYQSMEALDIGDAVSSITCDHAERMQKLGQPSEILVRFAHKQVGNRTAPLQKAIEVDKAGLIFHYWNYNYSTWLLSAVRGPKAIYYHNITPPECFPINSTAYKHSYAGYNQLKQIIHHFDLIIGDSRYNTLELAPLLESPLPGLHIYPVIKPYNQACDQEILDSLRRSNEIHIVFVGRIAPNKRQDRLIDLFDYYYKYINRYAHLWLVGNDQGHPEYIDLLRSRQAQSQAAERIHFTGKITEQEMLAFYQAADVFICASDHEGFCVPIIEAMSYDLPVIAYASTAIPETMGDAGILVQSWDVPVVAELVHLAAYDPSLRQRLIHSQQQNLQRFTADQALERLSAALEFLRYGTLSPLFEQVGS